MTVYPEAFSRPDLDPGPWHVEDSHASMVDFKRKHFRAPMHDGVVCDCGHDHAEGLRVHEYAHVAYTPANHLSRSKRARLPPDLVDAVEDCRVARRLELEAGETLDPVICPDAARSALRYQMKMRDYQGVITTMAASYTAQPLRDQVAGFVNDLQATCHDPAQVRRMIGEMSDLDDAQVVTLAQMLAGQAANAYHYLDMLGRWQQRYGDTITTARQLQNIASIMSSVVTTALAAAKDAKETEKALAAAKEKGPKKSDIPGMKRVPGMGDTFEVPGTRWCRMKLETAPLTRPAKVEPTRKWTSREEGVIPQAIHRWCVDGRIFKQPVHRGEGYTVLIDCSGSMSWGERELQELLDRAPATTVALYSSDGDEDGTLRIVAHNGKRAEARWITAPSGYGNGIDGPALRWLAQQKTRRIWICDGVVTGVGDRQHQSLSKDVRNLVAAHDIMRIHNGDRLVEIVTGKLPFKPTSRANATMREY